MMFPRLISIIIGLYCCPSALSSCNPDSAVRLTGIYGKPYSTVKVKNEAHCYKLCSYSKMCKGYNYIYFKNESECQLLSSEKNDLISSTLTASYVVLSDPACTPFAKTNPCDNKPCELRETCILIESGEKYMCIKNVIECGELSLEDGIFMKSLERPAIAHTTATYECEIGYRRLAGSGVSTCNANGTWTPLDLNCQEIECGNLTLSEGAEMKSLPSPARYNSIAIYECKYGYRYINGSNSTTCGIEGTWGDVDLTCEIIQCNTPSNIWQIVGARKETDQIGPFYLDAVQPYVCNPNYNLTSGDGRSICLSNSTWSKNSRFHLNMSDCKIMGWVVIKESRVDSFKRSTIVCGDLPTSRYAIPDGVPSLPFVGTSVSYTCNSTLSNHLSGEANISCLPSTEWSQLEIKCVRRCDEFPTVENAIPAMFHIPSELGCQVKYSCEPGHAASGNTTSTCTEDGWTQPDMTCTTS